MVSKFLRIVITQNTPQVSKLQKCSSCVPNDQNLSPVQQVHAVHERCFGKLRNFESIYEISRKYMQFASFPFFPLWASLLLAAVVVGHVCGKYGPGQCVHGSFVVEHFTSVDF